MKILHLLPNLADDRGGVSFSAADIISQEAQAHGVKSDIITFVPHVADGQSRNTKKLTQAGVHTQRWDGQSDITAYLTEQEKKLKPDAIMLWLPEGVKELTPFLKESRAPLLLRASTMYDMDDMDENKKTAYKNCFLLIKEKQGTILVNSTANQNWISDHFGVPAERQRVITEGVSAYNAINPPSITRESLGIAPEAYVVSNITRLSSMRTPINYRKDPFGFVLMAAHLSKSHPNAVFVMAGADADSNNAMLQHWIADANRMTGGHLNAGNFKALGHVNAVEDIYRMSDICVATSVAEAFGRSVVEAMHFGVPSIVTNVGIMPEMNGKASHVIPKRTFGYRDQGDYLGSVENNNTWLDRVNEAFNALQRRSSSEIASDAKYLNARATALYGIERVAADYVNAYQFAVTLQNRIQPKDRVRSGKQPNSDVGVSL